MSGKTTNENPKEEKEEIIEIDHGMIRGAKAKRVKALHIDERFMKTELDDVRKPRELRHIFSEIKEHMSENVVSIHVRLDQTVIRGVHLGTAMNPNIVALHVHSGLFFENQLDREALGRAIYEHESLSEIKLHNLGIREGVVARFSRNPPPPMDILVPAFSSILFLNILELSGQETKALDPTKTDLKKPMLSLVGIKELLKCLTLERLDLSRMGLTDDHLGVMAEQISQNPSTCLREVILNQNDTTEYGVAMLATLLDKPDCPIEALECYQDESVVSGSTLDMIIQTVKTNTTLKHLHLHLWGDDGEHGMTKAGKELDFYLRLNRIGRKKLVTPTTTRREWVSLVVDAKDEPDLLYYTLRNSSYWWKHRLLIRCRKIQVPLSELSSPVTSPRASYSKSSRTPTSNGRRKKLISPRLKELKKKHGGIIEGLNLDLSDRDDLSDIGENDVTDDIPTEDLLKELKKKNLPLAIDLDEDEMHNSRLSVISMSDQTYISDLMHQREKVAETFKEEILEDALEELESAKKFDQLPPGMSEELFFHKVFTRLQNERKKEEKKRQAEFDDLLERELLKAVAREKDTKDGTVNYESGDTPKEESKKESKKKPKDKSNGEGSTKEASKTAAKKEPKKASKKDSKTKPKGKANGKGKEKA